VNVAGATERLIERLAAEAQPVRRLAPPTLRAGLWLLVVAAVLAAALPFADLAVFVRRADDPRQIIELAATLLTGIAAILAAFQLSLPDRSALWSLLPVPFLVLWLGSSGYGCYRSFLAFGHDTGDLAESAHCFRFILGVSVPLAASLLVLLRRARPLAPFRVAAVGGLGVAATAAFALQFFHPFDVTFMDLGIHLVAIGIVICAMTLVERFAPTS
jgi:hypothetical protein